MKYFIKKRIFIVKECIKSRFSVIFSSITGILAMWKTALLKLLLNADIE